MWPDSGEVHNVAATLWMDNTLIGSGFVAKVGSNHVFATARHVAEFCDFHKRLADGDSGAEIRLKAPGGKFRVASLAGISPDRWFKSGDDANDIAWFILTEAEVEKLSFPASISLDIAPRTDDAGVAAKYRGAGFMKGDAVEVARPFGFWWQKAASLQTRSVATGRIVRPEPMIEHLKYENGGGFASRHAIARLDAAKICGGAPVFTRNPEDGEALFAGVLVSIGDGTAGVLPANLFAGEIRRCVATGCGISLVEGRKRHAGAVCEDRPAKMWEEGVREVAISVAGHRAAESVFMAELGFDGDGNGMLDDDEAVFSIGWSPPIYADSSLGEVSIEIVFSLDADGTATGFSLQSSAPCDTVGAEADKADLMFSKRWNMMRIYRTPDSADAKVEIDLRK